jgi:hypothetical protein
MLPKLESSVNVWDNQIQHHHAHSAWIFLNKESCLRMQIECMSFWVLRFEFLKSVHLLKVVLRKQSQSAVPKAVIDCLDVVHINPFFDRHGAQNPPVSNRNSDVCSWICSNQAVRLYSNQYPTQQWVFPSPSVKFKLPSAVGKVNNNAKDQSFTNA